MYDDVIGDSVGGYYTALSFDRRHQVFSLIPDDAPAVDFRRALRNHDASISPPTNRGCDCRGLAEKVG
jgi:hypothetical protein